ncbi:OmpW family protein [Microbulbifer sp. 2205BS26-8]|uniref:OmpW/AlkL family protein n=1 Tax=Microbulbifer sp. 2205BS26-8 TaxID=3064386 RepID=UPI00273D4983|nr:OmpW family outer membrane protein [Microbulbifer sp. 2205BS26-8]MDP5210908.1 OmpW family outer membrane protein [Microbulbifer sp. 2205BS26-8]
MKEYSLVAAFCACVFISGQALAEYKKGDFILRIGAAAVDPDDDSDNLYLNSTQLPGTRVYVDTGYSASITGTWLFADHWGLELLAAAPFKHNLDVRGLPDPVTGQPLGRVRLGDIKHLPPTLSVQWYPVCTESPVQPYIGVGVNYTHFLSEHINSAAQRYFDTVLGAKSRARLKLDNSWGLAGEIGIDIAFARESRWQLNAAIWYLDIDTDATIRFFTDGYRASRINVNVDIDPFVYSLGIGYRF